MPEHLTIGTTKAFARNYAYPYEKKQIGPETIYVCTKGSEWARTNEVLVLRCVTGLVCPRTHRPRYNNERAVSNARSRTHPNATTVEPERPNAPEHSNTPMAVRSRTQLSERRGSSSKYCLNLTDMYFFLSKTQYYYTELPPHAAHISAARAWRSPAQGAPQPQTFRMTPNLPCRTRHRALENAQYTHGSPEGAPCGEIRTKNMLR